MYCSAVRSDFFTTYSWRKKKDHNHNEKRIAEEEDLDLVYSSIRSVVM